MLAAAQGRSSSRSNVQFSMRAGAGKNQVMLLNSVVLVRPRRVCGAGAGVPESRVGEISSLEASKQLRVRIQPSSSGVEAGRVLKISRRAAAEGAMGRSVIAIGRW